jgi:hypothetical protein
MDQTETIDKECHLGLFFLVSPLESSSGVSLSSVPSVKQLDFILDSNTKVEDVTDFELSTAIRSIPMEDINSHDFIMLLDEQESVMDDPTIKTNKNEQELRKKNTRVTVSGREAVQRHRESRRIEAQMENRLIQEMLEQLQETEKVIQYMIPCFRLPIFTPKVVKEEISAEQRAELKRLTVRERKKMRDRLYARIRYRFQKEMRAERKRHIDWLTKLSDEIEKILQRFKLREMKELSLKVANFEGSAEPKM